MNISAGNAQGWALLVALVGLASAVFWMVVGWRAMRAHERLADAAEQAARKLPDGGN